MGVLDIVAIGMVEYKNKTEWATFWSKVIGVDISDISIQKIKSFELMNRTMVLKDGTKVIGK